MFSAPWRWPTGSSVSQNNEACKIWKGGGRGNGGTRDEKKKEIDFLFAGITRLFLLFSSFWPKKKRNLRNAMAQDIASISHLQKK